MAECKAEVAVVLGTRPEIIKLAPVLRELEARDRLDPYLVHTDQHYDEELTDVFFENLGVSLPDEHLDVGSGSQGEQTADGLVGVERVIQEREPAAVLALGGTNAGLSAALAASKTNARFAHLEAGVRSFDDEMPEETNRVVADRLADLRFAPTETAAENLAREGSTEMVFVTGNTIVDACLEHEALATDHSDILTRLGLAGESYALATIHRQQNTADSDRLRTIVETLDTRAYPVVLPAHPRTQNALSEIGFEATGSLRLLDPVDYFDLLQLLGNARVVVTDSGGIQEEASILEVPCLTVRPSTERPETVDAGVNKLVEPGALAQRLDRVFTTDAVHDAMTGQPGLYGTGDTSQQIVDILETELCRSMQTEVGQSGLTSSPP